jgi:hypothetical protein
MDQKLVELDGRRRASLATIAHPGHSRYLAHAEADGTIIMRPVEIVPAVVGQRPATLAPAVEVGQEPADTLRRFRERLPEPLTRPFREPPKADDGTDW